MKKMKIIEIELKDIKTIEKTDEDSYFRVQSSFMSENEFCDSESKELISDEGSMPFDQYFADRYYENIPLYYYPEREFEDNKEIWTGYVIAQGVNCDDEIGGQIEIIAGRGYYIYEFLGNWKGFNIARDGDVVKPYQVLKIYKII